MALPTFADEALIVTNPEVSLGARLRPHPRHHPAVAARHQGEASQGASAITRYSPKRVEEGEMLSHRTSTKSARQDRRRGIDCAVSRRTRAPAIHLKDSDVADAYLGIVDRFGDDKPLPCRPRKARPVQATVRREIGMSLLSLIFGNKPKTAAVAKERLQLIIAHERNGQTSSRTSCPTCRKELIAVISKYVSVNPDDIKVSRSKSKATTRCLKLIIASAGAGSLRADSKAIRL